MSSFYPFLRVVKGTGEPSNGFSSISSFKVFSFFIKLPFDCARGEDFYNIPLYAPPSTLSMAPVRYDAASFKVSQQICTWRASGN